MIISKIIFTIFIGLLLSIGLWIACYILLTKMYPKYSLQLRHHIFSFLVAITTFVLYCSFSTVSVTISGIEYALNSVKEAVIEKSDLSDKFMTALSSSEEQPQFFIDEVNQSVLSALKAHNVSDKYIRYFDFSKILDNKRTNIVLNAANLSLKEKSQQLIHITFDSCIGEFTRALKRTWRTLLIVMIAIQLVYFGTMIYRAEHKSRINHINKSRSFIKTPKTMKNYGRRSSDYRPKRYRR